ncbi:cell division cycle-associated protein 2 [Polymixia lowei]
MNMADPELTLNTASNEGASLPVDASCPLDFSLLKPSQFGISTESFNPSSNSKDKSRLAKLKARRRSNIGVRGSPETNSLIRYIAQQRAKTPPTPKTPELIRSSPFLPRVSSTLKQKMASFQSLMDVEERGGCDPVPRQDGETGGCIKTRDYLSDERSLDGGKENCPPPSGPTPSKRRCVGPLRDCVGEIRDTSSPILKRISQKVQEVDEKTAPLVVTPGPKLSSEPPQEAHTAFFFQIPHLEPHTSCSPHKSQQEGSFELQSPGRPQPEDLAAGLPAQPSSSLPVPSSLPSLLEMKPTGEGDSSANSTVKKKKKRVHFGGPLSPEFFDRNLPPSTPLQKGATPARAATPGNVSGLRSVLRTPQRSEPWTSLAQPDFSSPDTFGASPIFAMPRSCRVQPVEEDGPEMCEKIVFPSMEATDCLLTDSEEDTWKVGPLDLNASFQEECLTVMLTDSAPEPEAVLSGPSQAITLEETEPQPEAETDAQPETVVAAPARCSKRKRQPRPEPESLTEAPAPVCSSSRKRKQPERIEPVKRSSRSAAKSASGKMKKTAGAKRRWGAKEVDRSLYGSREYASKDPVLSPITESLSSASRSPTPQQPRPRRCTAPDQEPRLPCPSVEEATNSDPITGLVTAVALLSGCSPANNNVQDTGDITTAAPWEAPAECVAPSEGEGDRRSGPRLCSSSRVERRDSGVGRGRGRRVTKVGVPVDDWLSEEPRDWHQAGGEGAEHSEDQATANLQATEAASSNQNVLEMREKESALDAPSLACSPLDGEITDTVSVSEEELANRVKSTQRKAKCDVKAWSRSRGSVNGSVLEEREAHQTGHKVEENGQRDPAASQLDTNSQSSSDNQTEEGANRDLAPWQAPFNCEDMFKPVTSRGQRSVRRSLRNQSKADYSSSDSGLAWLPRTSPDSIRETRRRTRGKRLSATLSSQHPLPEESDR